MKENPLKNVKNAVCTPVHSLCKETTTGAWSVGGAGEPPPKFEPAESNFVHYIFSYIQCSLV